MNFKLKIRTSDKKLSLFDAFNQGEGMDVVDFVREELGDDIDISLIERTCDIDMHRSEREYDIHPVKRKGIIESYPVFKHFNIAEVIVPVGWFGQFVTQSVEVEYHEPHFEDGLHWVFRCMVIPYLFLLYFRISHKQKFKNHKNGTKLFPMKKITVMNTYAVSDVIDAWVEAGMKNYWGITEERHTEMMMREIACQEERQRKEAEAKRLKKEEELRKLKVKTESEIWDFDAIAEDLDTMSRRIRLAQEKHNKAAALKAGVPYEEKEGSNEKK